jgi:branched-chain amino acid transport system ATP-binding protein
VLQINDLTGGYGETTVLRGVSLMVPDSSVVALLGPNGAGKTTLLRMVAGLLRPQSGSVVFDGADVTDRSASARSSLGLCLIPEGRGIFPSLTVKENVALQSPPGREAEAAEKAVEAFPILGERWHYRAGSLSGGQQQMLALSHAFVCDPRLVCVDEASLGLAPVLVDSVFEALAQLAEKGTSLLIVEQFVSKALALAQTAFVLSRGSVVFSGSGDDLRSSDIFARYLGAGRQVDPGDPHADTEASGT